jgi:hypothetical protein
LKCGYRCYTPWISGTYETVIYVLLYESWRDSPYCIVVPSGPGKDIEGRDENLHKALTFSSLSRSMPGQILAVSPAMQQIPQHGLKQHLKHWGSAGNGRCTRPVHPVLFFFREPAPLCKRYCAPGKCRRSACPRSASLCSSLSSPYHFHTALLRAGQTR